MIELGQKAKDKVTGFEGILTARASYLTGCDQYGLTPVSKDNEIKQSEWFDEGRIEVISKFISAGDVKGKVPGGPQRDQPR